MCNFRVNFWGMVLFVLISARLPAAADDVTTPVGEVVTQHAIILGDQTRLTYSATAGTLPLINTKGEAAARVFYTAYRLADKDPKRPITFVFNGGPGAAAAFLHLAAMGPRVVNFTDDGSAPLKPVQLKDNPDSWLAFTDLVFVDPVGTGYSRAIPADDEAARNFYTVDKDADAMTDFVNLYLARNGRSLTPIFLAGESYGGFRAAKVAKRLLRSGVQVTGAVLISPALEFGLIRGDDYALLPDCMDLPSIAAANAELKGGANAPLDILPEVEKFAREGCLTHRAAGRKSNDAITAQLARYTGISTEAINRNHSRVSQDMFMSEFLKRSDRALSAYDAAVSVPVPKPTDDPSYDPILDGAGRIFTPAMAQYAVTELNYRTDLPYHLLNLNVNRLWDFGQHIGYPGAMDDLQDARMQNPALRVLVTHGYTDLVTPYSASAYLISQLKPIEGAAPVEMRVYRGGHMMYMRPASRRQLTNDANTFYREALTKP